MESQNFENNSSPEISGSPKIYPAYFRYIILM